MGFDLFDSKGWYVYICMQVYPMMSEKLSVYSEVNKQIRARQRQICQSHIMHTGNPTYTRTATTAMTLSC